MKARLVLTLAGLIAAVATVAASDSTMQSLAVLDFEAKGIAADEASVLSDRFREALYKAKVYTVLERGAMDAVLKEQGFQQSGCVSTECAIEVGQMVGVKYMAAGSVGKLGDVFVVSVRLIEVASGVISNSQSAEVKGAISEVLSVLPALARSLGGPAPEPPRKERHARSTVAAPAADPPPPEQPKSSRRFSVLLGVGALYGAGPTTLRVDSIEFNNPYTVRHINQYNNAQAQTFGGALTVGFLFKRVSIALQLMGSGPIEQTYRFGPDMDSSSVYVTVSRSGAGASLLLYYEPYYFRERHFGIAPGISAGIQSLHDEIYTNYQSRESVDNTRFGALNAKMRLGGHRVFATLEYAFTLGAMNERTAVRHWMTNEARVYSTYDHGSHSNLLLSVVVRL